MKGRLFPEQRKRKVILFFNCEKQIIHNDNVQVSLNYCGDILLKLFRTCWR